MTGKIDRPETEDSFLAKGIGALDLAAFFATLMEATFIVAPDEPADNDTTRASVNELE